MEHKEFDHNKASVSDKIRLIGELCHIRSHAIRSAVSSLDEPGDEDDLKSIQYSLVAANAQDLRRRYMQKHFPQISDHDWCLCKAAATLRQVAYEVYTTDVELLREIDNLVDSIWEAALGVDLSDCAACKEDREEE